MEEYKLIYLIQEILKELEEKPQKRLKAKKVKQNRQYS